MVVSDLLSKCVNQIELNNQFNIMSEEIPCVRVPTTAGERTRTILAEQGLIDTVHEIDTTEDYLYIPVVDSSAVPDRFEIVTHGVTSRDTPTTPADILGFDPSYERLGEIIIIDEADNHKAREIADAIIESDIPVKTVLNRASKVSGPHRTREWEVLAGEETETCHREYGYAFRLDIESVYFSPRLATERHRVITQVDAHERVIDMFAGVGPFAVPMAARGADVVAAELNDSAVEYLSLNAEQNDVVNDLHVISGDVQTLSDTYTDWADRLIMNLPHSAHKFLNTAVRLAGDECVIHYYDIQHEDTLYKPGIEAIRSAAEPNYQITVETRHAVRSYAPHEYNICLDVRLQKR
ncbi:MAG: putative methyltransferase [Haloquadratum walsbyi J07HQW1]|uniref:Putative methyltransferase n=1 Tax=Haloquadratum walsbyi J07HQW1 TaxID=1238424 RepID=U1N337_9EURY|nr:MAG: putative methyltransferase [Haloquadratum walsbyi J07HQW1]